MARSLARRRPPLGVAAALAALSLASSAPRPHAPRVPPAALAAHAAASASRWGEAPIRIYDAVERTGLSPRDAAAVARTVLEESGAAALDPRVVLAVIRVESGFHPRAVSPAGALGLMQLMPPTLREVTARSGLGADPFDPVGNVRAGVRYLTELVAAFGDLELALMAYNAGPARIRAHLRAGGIPVRFHRYPRDVLRLARSAEPASAARPAPRLAVAHARPAVHAAAVVPASVAQLPWFAARELPQDGGAALPVIRRGLLAPAVLLAA